MPRRYTRGREGKPMRTEYKTNKYHPEGSGRKASTRPKVVSNSPRTAYQNIDGIIYFIMNMRETGWLPKRSIKIGFTTRLEQRLAQLSVFEPIVLGVFNGNMAIHEAGLHKQYLNTHISGEWFKCTPKLMQYILDNTEQPNLEPTYRQLQLEVSRLTRRVEYLEEALTDYFKVHGHELFDILPEGE